MRKLTKSFMGLGFPAVCITSLMTGWGSLGSVYAGRYAQAASQDFTCFADDPALADSPDDSVESSRRFERMKAVIQHPERHVDNGSIEIEVTQALRDTDISVQVAAIDALRAIGATTPQAFAALSELAASSDKTCRSKSCRSLVALGADPELVLTTAARGLEDHRQLNDEATEDVLILISYLFASHYAMDDLLQIVGDVILAQDLKDENSVIHELCISILHRYYNSFPNDDSYIIADAITIGWFGHVLWREGDLFMYIPRDLTGPAILQPAGVALPRLLSDPVVVGPGADIDGLRAATRIACVMDREDAGELIPVLQTLLKHRNIVVRVAAAEALTRLDGSIQIDEISNILETALQRGSGETRLDAARGLLWRNRNHRGATAAIESALRGGEALTRSSAIKSLAEIAPRLPADPFVPILTRLLEDERVEDIAEVADNTSAAVIAVGRFGLAARTVAPLLLRRLMKLRRLERDAVEDPRFAAEIARTIIALGRIGETELTLPGLKDALFGSQVPRPGRIAYSSVLSDVLGSFGAASVSSVPALSAGLEHQSSAVRIETADSLSRIGAVAGDAVPSLKRALRDEEKLPRSRVHAALALWRINRDYRDSIPVLVEILQEGTCYLERRDAARVLGEIGPNAIEAIPALKRATNDPNLHVRKAAESALQSANK